VHSASTPTSPSTFSPSDQPEAALVALGWGSFQAGGFAPFRNQGLLPARVAAGHGVGYRLYTASGEVTARLAGRLRHQDPSPAARPAVGDWVAISEGGANGPATIQAVLPRRTSFSRKAAGEGVAEQVVAANVDSVLLVTGLDFDFNPRRLERYLVLAWESGARPAIVLNKADLNPDLEAGLRQVEASAPGVPIHPLSALRGEGLEQLEPYLGPGQTVALLGSSGAGKSTLINRLIGRDLLRTGAVREKDSRGRHTTTQRELIRLPNGGLIVDTPGLREIQLWVAEQGHQAAFEDLETIAQRCRFGDCSHQHEPGCAIRAAVESGVISGERFGSYLKLATELRHLQTRLDRRAQKAQEQQVKSIHRQMRHHQPRG
jgi:ribosome biogenesis GTPase / thiamine phosphate phosphatase